jgi:hypothetical protein
MSTSHIIFGGLKFLRWHFEATWLSSNAQGFPCIDFQATKSIFSATRIVLKVFYCSSAGPTVVSSFLGKGCIKTAFFGLKWPF